MSLTACLAEVKAGDVITYGIWQRLNVVKHARREQEQCRQLCSSLTSFP